MKDGTELGLAEPLRLENSRCIHDMIYQKYEDLSQFFYEVEGSSLFWRKEVVIRIWPLDEKEVSNLVEIHVLHSDELFPFEVFDPKCDLMPFFIKMDYIFKNWKS